MGVGGAVAQLRGAGLVVVCLELFGANFNALLGNGGNHLFEDVDSAFKGATTRDGDDGAVGLDGNFDAHVDDARIENNFDEPGAILLSDGALDHGIGNLLECFAGLSN